MLSLLSIVLTKRYLLFAIMSAWQGVGYQMIIFLGGLQGISPSLYEAAEMDHATPWQKFKDITLPELKPLLVFVLITVTLVPFVCWFNQW